MIEILGLLSVIMLCFVASSIFIAIIMIGKESNNTQKKSFNPYNFTKRKLKFVWFVVPFIPTSQRPETQPIESMPEWIIIPLFLGIIITVAITLYALRGLDNMTIKKGVN